MEGSVAIEHSHRLLASFVGLLTLAMAIIALQQKPSDKCRCAPRRRTSFGLFAGRFGRSHRAHETLAGSFDG